MNRKILCTLSALLSLSAICKADTLSSTALANEARILKDLTAICKTEQSRNYKNITTLNTVAHYIHEQLIANCDTVFYQCFNAGGNEYKNVVARFGNPQKEKIIIGAHYDVAGEVEGADDNASGIAGLLELSRILNPDSLPYQIEFVAYTLEEPPYFRTEQMGSFIHAKSLLDARVKIKGMICLEMIGYYSEQTGSQRYPSKALKPIYGNKGDFIAVVQDMRFKAFGAEVYKAMKQNQRIKTVSFTSPSNVSGIDFSDHLNYWKMGFDATMITNTAFYRNRNYHTKTDTLETLDIQKMCAVINELALAIGEL